jgi:hypothetical protein
VQSRFVVSRVRSSLLSPESVDDDQDVCKCEFQYHKSIQMGQTTPLSPQQIVQIRRTQNSLRIVLGIPMKFKHISGKKELQAKVKLSISLCTNTKHHLYQPNVKTASPSILHLQAILRR